MKQQQTFDSFITALKNNQTSGVLEIIAKRFDIPNALIRAIEFYGRKKEWKSTELAEFLDANRDLFERVYRTGRFLPPFPIDFSEVSTKLQEHFFIMAKKAGIKNPGDYIYLSEQKRGEYGYCDALVLLVPISSRGGPSGRSHDEKSSLVHSAEQSPAKSESAREASQKCKGQTEAGDEERCE